MRLSDVPDAELTARAIAGEERAYGALMQRHRDRVYRIARGHLGDADQALDVTQQVFVSAFAALHRYDPARPFHTWIARIAVNKCHDWARRRAVRAFLTFARPIDDASQVADDKALADVALADQRELARAMAAIAQLPARLKDVLVLRTLESFTQAEVAATLGISEKAVETRLYRARGKLAEMLRD
ncbi:RNA polymerase sigma factor [Sphingobium sp. H39-3-25]|uniref:RNA polymerase sigma factor n=1 Tax=Sphingobium arseniciresistens TaxID=3030834 RepID=UPI0023B8E65B|nr:RNA polymerase sigma factor [Sphingobium arseniciresistens]